MFKIKLSPIRSELTPPVVSAQGDVLTINGEAFDFSQLQEGETLMNSSNPPSVASEYIKADVPRENGYITPNLRLPYSYGADQSVRYPNPNPLVIDTDGPVTLPGAAIAAQIESEVQNNEQQ